MMKDQKTFSEQILIFYLSFFYTGFAPKAPGTMGSIAAIPLLYLLHLAQINFISLVVGLTLTIIATCILTDKFQKKRSLHDPQWIVIDEVLGMITTWLFIYPSFTAGEAIAILISFRIFDIVKIWPASYFDKMHHGSGTILDDIISGIFAGMTILAGKIFLSNSF